MIAWCESSFFFDHGHSQLPLTATLDTSVPVNSQFPITLMSTNLVNEHGILQGRFSFPFSILGNQHQRLDDPSPSGRNPTSFLGLGASIGLPFRLRLT